MDPLETLLLQQHDTVFVPAADRRGAPVAVRDLEVHLLRLGCTIDPPLHRALAGLSRMSVRALGRDLRSVLGAQLGADRVHVPLFLRFPGVLPTTRRRQFPAAMRQLVALQPEQRCPSCSVVGRVHALDPCGHLICGDCGDDGRLAVCPACRVALSGPRPFFERVEPPDAGPRTLRVLRLGTDRVAASRALLRRLLGRTTPLRPEERALVPVILAVEPERIAAALPERIPVKETMALTLGGLLKSCPAPLVVFDLAAAHLRTATDVLRVLEFYVGGDGTLVGDLPKLARLPRALRRGFLAALQQLEPHLLFEDLGRHPSRWKRLARHLHPFEGHARWPEVALGFAILRRTRIDPGTALGAALTATADRHRNVRLERGRARYIGWRSRVEGALRDGDIDGALRLARQRPGDLLRRFDHLVRTHPSPSAVVSALGDAARTAAIPVVLAVAAHLRTRTAPVERRVFFPRGSILQAWGTPDARPALAPEIVATARAALHEALLDRAARAPRLAGAVIDEALRDLPVPFNERTAARALIRLPRGSLIPLPEAGRLRLFLHWMQAGGEDVDLDLSVSFFDADWRCQGWCDYTRLDFGGRAAVHSGDYTEAPAPDGASEFIDLDCAALRGQGVRYLVYVIFSFTGTPFDRLPRAFAGYMAGHPEGAAFDPRAVEQRFDLQGRSQVAVPLSIDLEAGHLRWVDLHVTSDRGFNDVGGLKVGLAHLGRDMEIHFGGGGRATLWDVACLHGAARAPDVWVRRRSGAIEHFRREPGASSASFHARLHALADGQVHPPEWTEPLLAALMTDDLSLPPGSTAYALRRRGQADIDYLEASDLVTRLTLPGD